MSVSLGIHKINANKIVIGGYIIKEVYLGNELLFPKTEVNYDYNKVKVTPEVNIYPEDYPYPKFKRNRTLWQINNGAAGAPYYAQNPNTPWNDAVSGFSTQYALVLISIDGKKVHVKVLNPETFETIDEYDLRK